MRYTYTSAEVAERLGISANEVRQLARAHRHGHLVGGRVWQFSDHDIMRLRYYVGRKGRPRKETK